MKEKEKMGYVMKIFSAFQNTKTVKYFLLSLILTGLSYGIYKGVLDNFLAEVVHMGEMDRGVTEFFRELPGIALVLILAAFYFFSAERFYKMGALIMFIGMGMHAVLPPSKLLMTLAICAYSLGEHIQIGMKSTLSLQYARENQGGAALGVQNSVSEIGHLVGYLAVAVCFPLLMTDSPYQLFFLCASALALLSFLCTSRITGESRTDSTKSRFYFHRKYTKFYMLEMFYGARKQVFLTFGPYVLILFYKASAATVSLLFAISAVACFLFAPIIGKIIDRVGYKTVMVADTLILVIVCVCYGFAHHVFPTNVAFLICCVNYVLDAVISLASMASKVYVRDLADNPEEVKATISTGVSINHVITVFIALFGGWIWQTLGIETLFVLSAILGLCNSAYAATIKTKKTV